MKKLKMEIKEITEGGTFSGILSPYGNVDGGGDVVDPGAYTKTLKERGSTVPMLWQHKSDVPIGQLELEDSAVGLLVRGTLLMELPEAQKAYLLIKAKIVKGLSIGFESVKDAMVGSVRHLKEIKLYEGSIVTFPMNEMAMITAVKAKLEGKSDFNEELAEIQTLDARYQLVQALSSALSQAQWSGSRDDVVKAVATVLEQFTEAYTAFVPVYLDVLEAVYGDMEAWAAKAPEIKSRMEKSGATFSAASKKSLNNFAEMATAIAQGITALTAEEAGSPTSEAKAAEPATPPEPVAPEVDHSVVVSFIDKVRSMIPA